MSIQPLSTYLILSLSFGYIKRVTTPRMADNVLLLDENVLFTHHIQ